MNIIDTKNYIAQFKAFESLLLKWSGYMNLIAHSTENEIMERHIMDSFQLCDYIDADDKVVDIGSGAGFPGIVLSIAKIRDVTLIESNERKCTFLRMASLLSSNKVSVINDRIEHLKIDCDVVTCRALASVNKILEYGQFIKPRKYFLLLKGRDVMNEIEEAMRHWHFKYELLNDGKILKIDGNYKAN